MDIVTDAKVDWLGYKWYFIGLSVALMAVGALSLVTRGLNLGVDFTGGTLVYAKFKETPQLDRIRRALDEAGLNAEGVTRFDEASKNEVQIRMARIESDEAEDLDAQRQAVLNVLHQSFDQDAAAGGKIDLNNDTKTLLAAELLSSDPLGLKQGEGAGAAADRYQELAGRIVDRRTDVGGVLGDWNQLDALQLPEAVASGLKQTHYLGSFNLISNESVGAKVGQELRERATAAVLWSLVGMLVYIAFRFQTIYGFAAIVALFHDVFITLGFFSLAYKEFSLTVVAALLTLVGYSINDTIVIFDRVRENQKLMRRQDLTTIFNTSINQTLNRTIMTSGMTFLAVFALYMLGGPVLNGFSFALVVGIIVGTYSSIAIASPIVLWWQNYAESKKAKSSKVSRKISTNP